MKVELRNSPSDFLGEVIDHERLSIIGYSDIQWGIKYQNYPMPLLILDNELDFITRDINGRKRRIINTITPDFEMPNVYLNFSFLGNVEMPGEETEGKGYIYLGNASWPSDADAYILGNSTPINPDYELAYVQNMPEDPMQIIDTEIFEDKEYKLIYADANTINELGRLALS